MIKKNKQIVNEVIHKFMTGKSVHKILDDYKPEQEVMLLLAHRVRELEVGLAFYADPNTWKHNLPIPTLAWVDQGRKARDLMEEK